MAEDGEWNTVEEKENGEKREGDGEKERKQEEYSLPWINQSINQSINQLIFYSGLSDRSHFEDH